MPVELLKLTDKEFADMAKLIYDRTGIHLPESKLSLLSNRLRRRLRELDLDGFRAYYDLMRDPVKCEEELPFFLSAVTTNETYFFRNDALWKFFRETWIPEVVEKKKKRGGKTIRLWSAASSSGEEAYTAAICMLECIRDAANWNITIVGSDISKRVLDRARDAKYNDYAVSRVSKAQMRKWFDVDGDTYHLKSDPRKLVRFQFHNLRDPMPNANFDFVFLRNVLMYFDDAMKLKVLDNVTAALVPGGHLYIGDVDPVRSSRTLNSAVKLNYCGPNLYQKPDVSREKTLAKAGS